MVRQEDMVFVSYICNLWELRAIPDDLLIPELAVMHVHLCNVPMPIFLLNPSDWSVNIKTLDFDQSLSLIYISPAESRWHWQRNRDMRVSRSVAVPRDLWCSSDSSRVWVHGAERLRRLSSDVTPLSPHILPLPFPFHPLSHREGGKPDEGIISFRWTRTKYMYLF